MHIYKSKAEARRRAVEAPTDPAALMASSWPPFARSDLGRMSRVLCQAATLPGADGPRYFLSRLTQLAGLLSKQAGRYGRSKTWSMTAPNGREILFPLDDPGAVAFKAMADEYGKDYEKTLINFICERLRPGDVFVDVGAHVGYISAFAATTGAAAFAIEIQRELIPLIEQLAAINAFDTLRPLHAGASRRSGLSMIARTDTTPGGQIESDAQRFVQDEPDSIVEDFVPIITLDDAFGRDGLWPAMVKVDVEGHEIAVVDGAHRIIEQRRTTFVVEFHPHLIINYNGTASQLLAPFPADYWRYSQLTDEGLRPIRRMSDVTPDPRDPNPKLVFEPLPR
jgi:FkbM family methyltransferase